MYKQNEEWEILASLMPKKENEEFLLGYNPKTKEGKLILQNYKKMLDERFAKFSEELELMIYGFGAPLDSKPEEPTQVEDETDEDW